MKYAIWDFDGTLGYREGGMWTLTLLEIVRQALPELTVTREQLKSFLRRVYPWHMPERPHLELHNADEWWESLRPVFRRAFMGVGVPEEQANVLAGQFRSRYTDVTRWRLFPDTLPTLNTLSVNGWRHIVLSNHVPELPEILRHLGVIDQVVAVFNSAQTGYEKPHPQAFRNALDFIGDAEAVWMIGDNYTADVLGAEAAGIPGILVRKTHPEARYGCMELAEVTHIVAAEEL